MTGCTVEKPKDDCTSNGRIQMKLWPPPFETAQTAGEICIFQCLGRGRRRRRCQRMDGAVFYS
jgi:hypothetical protein